MKKIGFMIHSLSISGGVGKVVNTLANALCEDYEIYIFVLQDLTIYQGYSFDSRIHIELLNIPPYRLRKQQKVLLRFFPKRINELGIKVLFLEGTYCGYLLSVLSPFIKTKLVFCDHGSIASQMQDKKTTLIRCLASLLCWHTVVLTERSRNDYMKMFHIRPKRISCIYNWIDDGILASCVNHTYPVSSQMIISVGRFGSEKGYDMLVNVAKQVLPLNKTWEWHVYGTGELFNEIKEKIYSEDLQDQLILEGDVTDLTSVYKSAAFLVLPSYREGLPLVLLEGKAYKLPLVSFDVLTGPNEIITDGVDGYLIKPKEINEMAEKINYLINNQEKRVCFSKNTYNNIKKFQKETIIEQWIQLIESSAK